MHLQRLVALCEDVFTHGRFRWDDVGETVIALCEPGLELAPRFPLPVSSPESISVAVAMSDVARMNFSGELMARTFRTGCPTKGLTEYDSGHRADITVGHGMA